MATTLYYLNQFISTTLSSVGGIDDNQTTGIILASTTNIELNKPGIACLTYTDPIDTSKAEWITYTSIDVGTNELQGVVRGQEGYGAKTHNNGATVAFPLSRSHINNINDEFLTWDGGWRNANETWTYASATTITVPSGATDRYSKGDKIKLTQGSVKYFYIVGVTSTVLTITGGNDYTLTNSAITDNYYSHLSSPIGFPKSFTYTPTIIVGAGTAPTFTTVNAVFSINGGLCNFKCSFNGDGGIAGAGAESHLYITIPAPADTIKEKTNFIAGLMAWFGTSEGNGFCQVNQANRVQLRKSVTVTLQAAEFPSGARFLFVNGAYHM